MRGFTGMEWEVQESSLCSQPEERKDSSRLKAFLMRAAGRNLRMHETRVWLWFPDPSSLCQCWYWAAQSLPAQSAPGLAVIPQPDSLSQFSHTNPIPAVPASPRAWTGMAHVLSHLAQQATDSCSAGAGRQLPVAHTSVTLLCWEI